MSPRRRALVGGPSTGIQTMLGGATGLTVHAAAAALGLSAIFAPIHVAWFSGLVVLVDLVSGARRRPRVKTWIERVIDSALVAFGVRLTAATGP